MHRLKTIAVVFAVFAVAAFMFITDVRERNMGRAVSPVADRGVDRATLDFQNQLLCTEAAEKAAEPACVSVQYQGLEPGTKNGVAAYRTTYEFHLADGSSMLFTGWFRKSDGKYLEYVSLAH